MKTKLVKFLEVEDFKKLQEPLHRRAKFALESKNMSIQDKIAIRDFVVINLIYACALRISEVCKLEMKYLDMEKKLLYVIDGKGGDRVVPIPDITLDIIKKWLDIRPNLANNPYVFTSVRYNTKVNPLPRGYYNELIKKLALETGVRMKDGSMPHPHTLRHSRAMEIYDSGVQLELLQKLLGHKNITTTQIYAEVRDERVAEMQQAVTKGLVNF